jgi:hypothetical protein
MRARHFLSCDVGHGGACRDTVVCLTAHCSNLQDKDSTMHAEPFLAETSELQIRPDLVAALKHSGVVKKRDFHVESFKPTLLGRFAALWAPKRQP